MSQHPWEWLGKGTYFWEDDEERAWRWANAQKERGKVDTPAVLQAEISLGKCLDLLKPSCRDQLRLAYRLLDAECRTQGKAIPQNRKTILKKAEDLPREEPETPDGDLLFRYLDCAVIEMLHRSREEEKEPPYDTVRAAFQEGKPVYEGSCIRDKDHIQIAVRSKGCIFSIESIKSAA
jgi:hypothetical protein